MRRRGEASLARTAAFDGMFQAHAKVHKHSMIGTITSTQPCEAHATNKLITSTCMSFVFGRTFETTSILRKIRQEPKTMDEQWGGFPHNTEKVWKAPWSMDISYPQTLASVDEDMSQRSEVMELRLFASQTNKNHQSINENILDINSCRTYISYNNSNAM